MALLNTSRELSQNLSTIENRFFRGKCVDNDDPFKIGRVRIKVEGIHDNYENSQIPWSLSASNMSCNTGTGGLDIPPLNTNTWVLYLSEQGDSSLYFGASYTRASTLNEELLEDYPNTKGFVDDYNNVFVVNKKQGYFRMLLKDGAELDIHSDGIYLKTSNTPNDKFDSGVNIHVNGNVKTFATGSWDMQCTAFNLLASEGIFMNSPANMNINLGGSFLCTSGANAVFNSGGGFTTTSSSPATINSKSSIIMNLDGEFVVQTQQGITLSSQAAVTLESQAMLQFNAQGNFNIGLTGGQFNVIASGYNLATGVPGSAAGHTLGFSSNIVGYADGPAPFTAPSSGGGGIGLGLPIPVPPLPPIPTVPVLPQPQIVDAPVPRPLPVYTEYSPSSELDFIKTFDDKGSDNNPNN